MALLRAVYELFRETGSEWVEDKAPRLGAALAYYSVFAITPIVLLAVALAGVFYGGQDEQAREAVVAEIEGTLGGPVAKAVRALLENAGDPFSLRLASLAGVAVLLFGAAGVFAELQDALNTIWKVTPRPGRPLLRILRERFLSFTMVLGTGFLLLVSLVLSTVLGAVGNLLTPASLPGGVLLWQAVNWLVSLAFVALLFALMYKVLPDVELTWGDVWPGGVLAAVLFTVGKNLLGLYLARGGVGSAYGAAGSLVVVLVWVYYSAQLLLFGAEFTRAYARRYGSPGRPAANAVAVSPEARARQGMPRREDVEAAARAGS